MNTPLMNSLAAAALAIFLIWACGLLPGLPWWAFTVPVFALGLVMELAGRPAAAFTAGFAAGFVVWAGLNAWNEYSQGTAMLSRLAPVLSLSRPLLLAVSGVAGGLLAGLALYSGRVLVKKRS